MKHLVLLLSLLILFPLVSPAQQRIPASDPDTLGSAYVQLWLPQDQWHGYCLPVESSFTLPFNTLSLDMRWYDEPEHAWHQVVSPEGDSLLADRMRGYLLFSDSQITPNSTVGVKGNLNTGYMACTVTSTATGDHADGMNLIGNPYPSAVNWLMVGLVNVDPTMYVYSPLWRNYLYWNRPLGMHSGICRFILPAMQGFFVHCSSPGTGQVVMTNACRLHDPGQIYQDNPDYDNLMEFTVTGNGYSDEAHILFTDTASLFFDRNLDALKIPGDPVAPQLYSMLPNEVNLALNVRPWNGPYTTVNLGFSSGVSGTDTLTAAGLDTFSDTLEIWLQDKKEDYFQLLTEEPRYIFTSAPGDDPARFVIWFYSPYTSIAKNTSNPFRIWSFEDKLYIDMTRATGKNVPLSPCASCAVSLSLYDLAGRNVFLSTLEDGSLNILEPGLTKGYYVARVERGGQVGVQKLFLK